MHLNLSRNDLWHLMQQWYCLFWCSQQFFLLHLYFSSSCHLNISWKTVTFFKPLKIFLVNFFSVTYFHLLWPGKCTISVTLCFSHINCSVYSLVQSHPDSSCVLRYKSASPCLSMKLRHGGWCLKNHLLMSDYVRLVCFIIFLLS